MLDVGIKDNIFFGKDKDNIFFGKDIVKLDEKNPNYQQRLVNFYTRLENHFFKLVDDLILKEYNSGELCKNTVKFFIFINMLNLYHIYVELIQRSKDLDCACLESNVATKINKGTAVYFNYDGEYYVLDLEAFALRVETAFKPSKGVLDILECEKNKPLKEKVVNLFKGKSNELDKTNPINKKLAKDYKKSRFVRNNANTEAKIESINVFKKFISKMMDYDFGDENVDSKSKEKKWRVRLDFILTIITFYCDNKIFIKIQEWLINDYAKITDNNHEYDTEFGSVKGQIESLLKKKKGFRIPSAVVLRYILGSEFGEAYTLSALEDMFKIVQDEDNKINFKIQFIKKIVENEKKVIYAEDASNFMQIVNFFVNCIKYSQVTDSKTDKKAKIDWAKINWAEIDLSKSKLSSDLLNLQSENKKLVAKVLSKINVSLNIGNNISVLKLIMDLDNRCDDNFDVFAVFVEKFRFEIDLNDKNVKDKDKEEIKYLVHKMINILYLRYKNICDGKNEDSIKVFANTVKYFYGNFLYSMVKNKICQNIAPDDFTRLITIVGFLSEKDLLQKIIDSGNVLKEKSALQIQSFKNMHEYSVIVSETNNLTKNKALELQIQKNEQREGDLRNKSLEPKPMAQANMKLDKLPVPTNNNGNNMYPQLDESDSNINIINDYHSSLSNTNFIDKTMPQRTNKFDIHQINYDLCKSTLINFPDGEKTDFELYDLYRWYKYFIENRPLNINSLSWYKWFLMCDNYCIESKIASEIDLKLLADLLINVHQFKINEKTKKQSSFSNNHLKEKGVDSVYIRNICPKFENYIEYCFQKENLPNLKENMDRLIKFAEAILSLYIDNNFQGYANFGYIRLLTDKIDVLAKNIANVVDDLDDSSYIYCRYSLLKLILITKKHFLQFENTKKLDYLSSEYNKTKVSSPSQLEEYYKSAKEYEHLRLSLSHFDELEKKWEYEEDYNTREIRSKIEYDRKNGGDIAESSSKSEKFPIAKKKKPKKKVLDFIDQQASNIRNDVDKDNIENIPVDNKKSFSKLNYNDLENELTAIKTDNQRLKEDNHVLLVELFNSNVSYKSEHFVQKFGFLKASQEELYAITASTKELWQDTQLDKHGDTFFPLAFYLVKEFYETFRIKYEYCKSAHEGYKDVVGRFSYYVYKNFFGNTNLGIKIEEIENVLVDYFDQLVYADYFENELPKLLDERKNISKVLKELPKKVEMERNRLIRDKKNDIEIQHKLILSKLKEYGDNFWKQAKEKLSIQKQDKEMTQTESDDVSKEQLSILEATKKTDTLLECLYDLRDLCPKGEEQNSLLNIINNVLVKDNPTCNISNCEFLFGEGGKLRSEFENKKNEQLQDMDIDVQLQQIVREIIFNEKNKKEYVSWANIKACLEKYTKADGPKLELDIKTLSQNIARGIVFKQSDDPTDLFKSIQKIYAKNNNTDQYKIRLDDVFEIIKIMFLDEIISQKLINMLIDNSLFEQKSLSTKNLKTLAQIVEFKNKDIDTHETKNTQNRNLNNRNGKTLDDFMNFISVKHPSQCLGFDQSAFKPSDKIIKCDASTFFDCVVLFYRKKINHDGQTIGKFTTQEINQILNTFCSRCDDWIALCNFVKYNWNGLADKKENQSLDKICLDMIHKANSQNYEIQEIAISEFLKSLMHPIEILHKRIKENQLNGAYKDIYQWTFISGMVSIDSILRSCGSKIDISDIINKYASFLDDCINQKDKFAFLTDKDCQSMFGCLADLLGRSGTTTKLTQYISWKTVNAILKKAQTVKFPVYKLYRLIEFVHSQDTDFKDLTLFNYFKIKQEDYNHSAEAQSARKAMKKAMKHVLDRHLICLPNNCLKKYDNDDKDDNDDFDIFRDELLKTDLRLDVNQFILYLQLAGFSLIQNGDDEKTRFSLFDNYLEILSTDQIFTHKKLIDMAMCLFCPASLNLNKQEKLIFIIKSNNYNYDDCINNLDLKRDLVPMFYRLRGKSKEGFDIVSPVNTIKNKMYSRLSIAKSIANANAKNDLTDDIARIIYVLEQFKQKGMKLGKEGLEEIFKYYGLDKQKLNIDKQNAEGKQYNLALLIKCVQVLSSDQFKLENIINNVQNGKDKNKGENNIDSCFNSPAMKFLEANFIHSEYGTLQMGYDAIIELIDAVLSSQDKSSSDQQKQDLVLNLLCLFWTPVHDNKRLSINSLKNKISTTINDNKEDSWLNDSVFTKKVAVMYFVKHLYSLLLTIGQNTISSDEYKEISKSIQKLQKQLSDYNKQNNKTKISKEDISDLYAKMISEVQGENKNKKNNESKSHLQKVNLQAKLFEDIKDGILDLITYDDDNNDKNKNPKIIISFAILHAINNANNKDSNNYNLIFEEVIKSGAFGQDNKCDLEMLKFVFDQMLFREDNQNDTNRLSIPFNENGQKLFDRALGCLDDNSVQHSEIFDFLQDYFIPNGPGVVQQKPGLISKIFSRLKNLLKKIKSGGALPNNNDDYLKPENFKPKKREGQDSKENLSQDNNMTETEFKLRKEHVEQIMAKSKNRFLFYSNKEDNNASQAADKFLEPYKNGLASETIVKYISKFRFQNLDSFEDFMKKYWTYDQLFCDRDLTIIFANENFESSVEPILIKFCVAQLMLMNKLKNNGYENGDKNAVLAHLAKILKEIRDISVDKMQRDCLGFCGLKKDDENEENQEKIKKIERKIELLFGSQKRYKDWTWGLLVSLLVDIILFIILVNSSTFSASLLVVALILISIPVFCIKNLFDIKKFNDEYNELQKLGKDFKPQDKGLYTPDLSSPPQNLVVDRYDIDNNKPNMGQANPNIIDANLSQIPFQS